MVQSMGLQRVRHDQVTGLKTELKVSRDPRLGSLSYPWP